MIEEYNHGKEFPPLKALPGLRFRRRADPRDSSKSDSWFLLVRSLPGWADGRTAGGDEG